MFWPGMIGEFMSFMPLTLIVTLSSSLFVALIINPVITGYLVRVDENGKEEAWGPAGGAAWLKRLGAGDHRSLSRAGRANQPRSRRSCWPSQRSSVWLPVPICPAARGRPLRRDGSLPRLINWYREFLDWMLVRDYSVKAAMLRNTGALAAFSGGVVLLDSRCCPRRCGLARSPDWRSSSPAQRSPASGFSASFCTRSRASTSAGKNSFKAAVGLAIVVGGIIGLTYLGDAIRCRPSRQGVLLAVPATVGLFGILGALFNRREHLILTDNRARLLTGTLAVLFTVLAIFAFTSAGVAFFPTTDPNQVRVNLVAPEGTNIEASNQIAEEAQRRIDELLADNPTSFSQRREHSRQRWRRWGPLSSAPHFVKTSAASFR